jgi:hypothetical protein
MASKPPFAGACASAILALGAATGSAAEPDLRALVSDADIRLAEPLARSEEGLPIGNGRTGTLVWTTPSALRLQVNRTDIQPINRDTRSFFERHDDYCCGGGFVDVDLGGPGDVFAPPAFSQHLSVYDGRLGVEGRDVSARLVAWPTEDVIAIEIDDRRDEPQPVEIALRMLRFASRYDGDFESSVRDHSVTLRTRNHTAASQLHVRGGSIGLTQEFREGAHLNKSAVAIRVVGRAASPRVPHESEVRLRAQAFSGTLAVLVASASTLQADEDVLATALRRLDAAEARGFTGLVRDNEAWWHAFWSRGYVDLGSADGVADEVERNYHYFLYLMAASSRGAYPPKFNGMLWNTRGDVRAWGAQHWFANLSCYYEALFAAGRLELLDPVFDMYGGPTLPGPARRAAMGQPGVYVPRRRGSTASPAARRRGRRDARALPLRKPWSERSARFREFALTQAPFSSRWNWIGAGGYEHGEWVPQEKGFGPFGHTTHILGTTAKVGYLFWRRYEYSLDRAWLRDHAYPMIRGAAEFYRHFPNLRKDEDGRIHIHHVNSNESVLGARDTDEDLSAMRGILSVAVGASELLGVDAELRAAWRELLGRLAPLPTSDDPDSLRPDGYAGPRVFVRGRKPAVRAAGLLPDPNSLPMWFFDLAHVGTPDMERLALANATFDAYFQGGIQPDTPVSVLSKLAIAAAALGRADAVRVLVPTRSARCARARECLQGGGVLANRMTLREGHQALDAQRLGRASEALQLALLQSNPPEPGGDPVIRVFPAWPRDWDARYVLRARGAFVVSASIQKGRIGSVELRSLAGARARLRNPWGEASVQVWRDEKRAETLEGTLLTLQTRVGETARVVPRGAGIVR